jgi:hypothetical protein
MRYLVIALILTSSFTPKANAQQILLGAYHGVLSVGKAIPQAIRRKKRLKVYDQLVKDFKQNYVTGDDANYKCSNSLEVLYMNKSQSIPTKVNSLTFRNHADVYRIKNPFGYCWGHAKVTQKMNRLAIFRPDLEAPFKVGSRKWKKFYRKKIKKLTKYNKAQIIPGFANLYDFSSHPYIQQKLANAVQNSWAKLAVNIRGLKTGLKKQNTQEEKLTLIKQITERIDRNQHPLVNLHYLAENFTETHIVVLWKYEGEVEPGTHKFCARDNNSEYELNEKCNNHLMISTDELTPINYRQQKYADIDGITFPVGVMLSYNEDVDAVEQVESLSRLCEEQQL